MSPASPPNDSAPKQHYTGESTDYLETRTPKSTVSNQNSPQPKSRILRWWKKIQKLWQRPQPTPADSTIAPKGIETFLDLAQTQGAKKAQETILANESQADTNPTVERKPIDVGTVTFSGQREIEVSKIDNLLDEPTVTHEEKKSEPTLAEKWLKEFLTSVPGLEVGKMIGDGGMGLVYEAVDLVKRKWALKVTRPDKMSEQLKKRFFSEASEMAKLSHPNLVPIIEYKVHVELPYLTMPRYGSSVLGLMKKEKIPQQKAVRIFRDSIKGLAHLHELGYVHRDLKPGNILVDDKGNGLLSDFGLLKYNWDEETRTHNTAKEMADSIQTNGIAGTIPYLAPEVFVPDHETSKTPKPTPKWDVYAAGITLYEMLHGDRPPISRQPWTHYGVPRHEVIPPIRKVQPKTPKALEKIINKCCAVDSPYTDARDLLRELIRYETRWYRRTLLGMSVFFLGMVVALAMLWPPSQSVAEKTIPNAYAELYKELEEGKTVELIPKEGMPRFPFKVILGNATTPDSDNEYKSFAVYTTTNGSTFVELFPDLSEGEYELRGELRCSLVPPTQGYGAFVVGGQIIEVPRGKVFSAAMLAYADSLTTPQKAWFGYRSFALGAFTGFHDHPSDVFNFPNAGDTTWRNFAVRLKTKDIEFEFENKKANPILRTMPALPAVVQEDFDMIFKPGRPLKNQYSNRGIGLFASGCNISCRSLTLTRITPKE